ncbi:hypothetical protein MNV49_007641 [Pseudohyphozyma bogoriensis]|nr:hypothetical protein MNV49_007641 [Pseudohyphozyma bogoriensis]
MHPSTTSSTSPAPKSKLLISDLDNTLYAPVVHVPSMAVIPRPYFVTFMDYILHPDCPYEFAVWTFASEVWGLKHMRFLKQDRMFLDDNETQPLLADGVAAFWGLEQSGLTPAELNAGMSPGVKDLDLMWNRLNKFKARKAPTWSPLNSLIIDDQSRNAGAQPDSLIRPPAYRDTTDNSGVADEWLIQLIGALDELAYESNFASAIAQRKWYDRFTPDEEDKYFARGEQVCQRMGIKLRRGKKMKVNLAALSPPETIKPSGPPHDPVPEPTDKNGRVDVSSLRGCCQDPPHPEAVIQSAPSRDAAGTIVYPNELYEKIVAQPSQEMKRPKKPLIVFDLDGTLYERPPCHLVSNGAPSGRPYLVSFLTWLLRPSSPWSVAIWTASPKATAIKYLTELNLGIVGPKLVGPKRDEAELLHPKLVALWAREDLGLSPEDFNSYVSIVKDLDSLWYHLQATGEGNWSAYDTVMIDDTANKLRAQPDSLINPPTFRFPLVPGSDATAALLDTFLLQLAGMLDELEIESNFSNYIMQHKWNHGVPREKQEYFTKRGVEVIQREKILVAAEGLGPLPGPNFPLSGSGLSSMPRPRLSSLHIGWHEAPKLTKPPTSVSRPLDDTFGLQDSTTPPSPDTPSSVATSSTLSSPASPAPAPAQPPSPTNTTDSSAPSSPSSATSDTDSEPHPDNDVHSDSDSDDDATNPPALLLQGVSSFVPEEEERARLHHRSVPRGNRTPRQRLDFAVRDWEDEVERDRGEAKNVPLVWNEPYADPGYRAYRRNEWDPNVSQDD